jgi:hypothetical protein
VKSFLRISRHEQAANNRCYAEKHLHQISSRRGQVIGQTIIKTSPKFACFKICNIDKNSIQYRAVNFNREIWIGQILKYKSLAYSLALARIVLREMLSGKIDLSPQPHPTR